MENNQNTRDQTALERYRIIGPILSAMEGKADRGLLALLKGEACAGAGISRKTLARWLDRYTAAGFDGLKYQGGTAEPKRRIPGELVKEAAMDKAQQAMNAAQGKMDDAHAIIKFYTEKGKQSAAQQRETN